MNGRNNSDWGKTPGSDNTDSSQASQLPSQSQDVQLVWVPSAQCHWCRDRRSDTRCQRWIEACMNAYAILQEARNRDRDQNEEDRDLDEDGEGEREGDEDRDGEADSSTRWVRYSNQPNQRNCRSISLSSEPSATRQGEFVFQWPYHLELALDVVAGLALLSLLRQQDSGMPLPPLLIFILYLLLTIPLAMVLDLRLPQGWSWRLF